MRTARLCEIKSVAGITVNQESKVWLLAFMLFILAGHSVFSYSDDTPHATDSIEERFAYITDNDKRLNVLLGFVGQRQYQPFFKLSQLWVKDLEGDVWFDFYYGLSALETGHYNQALFAFERLVIGHPRHVRYRLELARTFYNLQSFALAEQEFNTVLKQKPPEAVKKNVLLFLNNIKRLHKSFEPVFSASINFAYGYDSNINSGSQNRRLPKEELVFPVDIILNEESQKTASHYYSTNLNGFYSHPLSKRQHYDLRARYAKRENNKTVTYDLDNITTETGYSFQKNAQNHRAAFGWQNTRLNNKSFVSNIRLSFQSQWSLDHERIASFEVSQSQADYNQNTNNITTYEINASLSGAPQQHNWLTSISVIENHADHREFKFIGKNSYSLNLQVSSFWKNRLSSTLLLNHINSHYHGINTSLYTQLRKDQTWNIAIGINYKLDKHLNFQNNYSYSISDSTLTANAYSKGKIEFGINYIF